MTYLIARDKIAKDYDTWVEEQVAYDVIAWHSCSMECGNKIGDFQDDCGAFYVQTPNHGYAGICKTCWDKGGYSTAER